MNVERYQLICVNIYMSVYLDIRLTVKCSLQ